MTRIRSPRRLLAPAVLAAVTALAAWPFLGGRYPFLLDFVAGPGWDPIEATLYGFRAPAYGGSLPLLGALSLVPPSLAAKALVPGVLVLLAAAGYVALPGPRWARLYGALLLVANPFVYARMIAGQWAVVWGLAMLPVVLWTVTAYLEEPGPRRLLLAVGSITLLGFSAHLLYASAVMLGFVTIARLVEVRDVRVIRRALTVVLVAVPVNAYWLVPSVFADGGPLGEVSSHALDAYAPAVGSASALSETATMHGFWRGATVYARDLAPAVEIAFVVVFFLAVYGALARHDGERGYVVRGLVLTAAVALLLAAGVRGPAEPAFRWLADAVPFFAGMRDSNKFVALLVVAYAYLGALGVAELLDVLADLEVPDAVGGLGDDGLPGGLDARRGLRWAVVGLVVLAPLVYTFPMVTGYAGQVTTGDYPEEWYEVETVLEGEDDHNVLLLPWHRYQDLSWIEGPRQRVATPGRAFFSAPIVQGDNVELGPVYSTSTNRVSRHVESLFGLGPSRVPTLDADAGERLAAADVHYVLVAKETDWVVYDDQLADQPDLTLVHENARFRVYRNDHDAARAYATDRPAAGGDREPLSVTERSPATLRVDGSSLGYAAVAHSQTAAGPGWRYDGEPAVGHADGVRPVYPADESGGELRYAPFYRLYLPSYAVSIVAVLALAGYGLLAGTDRTSQRRRWPWPGADTQNDD